jgi:hypothetical protein
LTPQSRKALSDISVTSPVVRKQEASDCSGMGSQREKRRDPEKSRKEEIKQKRKEIAELQRKLKETIERRNGKMKNWRLDPFEITRPGSFSATGLG